jgi:hypothetical protein
MDQFEQPQSDQILPNYSGNIVVDISKIGENPSQLKKKSTIISNNFPKRITMTKGPTKDVTQYLAIQGRPKRIQQKEVMKLLLGSPSKVGGNLVSLGTSKKNNTRNKIESQGM